MIIKNGPVTLRTSGVRLVFFKEKEPLTYRLDRIEVPAPQRRKGVFSKVLKDIILEADERGIQLTMQIFPDGYERGKADEIAEGMRRVTKRLGFQKTNMDGTIYRNDLYRYPKKRSTVCRSKK